MRSDEIRRRFLEYFSSKKHSIVPSSNLIPTDDPTLLFTNAGMVQFKSTFLGDEVREYSTAVSCQKCMRAGGKHNDLENVGQTARHLTFFEMLGNFSFGDYFKAEAIQFAWEFFTVEMKLPPEKLYATVFEEDDEAAELWKKHSTLPPERIIRLGAKDNFWSMGDVGPCGPCSEILIDQGEELGCDSKDCKPGCDCDRYLELWNLVFMQFNRDKDGKLTPLPKPSIDTGMGLERLAAVMQGVKSNFDIDIFIPIIEKIIELTKKDYKANSASRLDDNVSMRAIADHSRAVAFLIADGILPSNEGRGYVLRRIIRRALRHGRFLGLTKPFLWKVSEVVTEVMGETYPELRTNKELIIKATRGEEERFLETLERGLQILSEEVAELKKAKKSIIPGDTLFKLYDTYGFPVDLTADIIKKDNFTIDEDGFNKLMQEQKKLARESWKGDDESTGSVDTYQELLKNGIRSKFIGYDNSTSSSKILAIIKDGSPQDKAKAGDSIEVITTETPFYGESGGQRGDIGIISSDNARLKVTNTLRPLPDIISHHVIMETGHLMLGDSVELTPARDERLKTAANHSATHILHAVLRAELGEHLRQAGSLVTPKGLRFDFNHFSALTDKELSLIELKANEVVRANIDVITSELPYKEAIKRGALAFFGEKYTDTVRMISIDNVSTELCGGTHVQRSGDIGIIKITTESSVASGVRRIEALTGEAALLAFRTDEARLKQSAHLLKSTANEVPERIERLMEKQKELEHELSKLKNKDKSEAAGGLSSEARMVSGIKVLSTVIDSEDPKELRFMADTLRKKLGSAVIVLGSKQDNKVMLLAAVAEDLTKKISAGEIVKQLAPIVGGKGGGRRELAQAGGKLTDKLDTAIEAAYKTIEELLKTN